MLLVLLAYEVSVAKHCCVVTWGRYGKQYQYFQQIIAVYESEPDNFARLSELMQEMQETGQPPSEIVKDLAPGLQFDDEGNPVMPNMVRHQIIVHPDNVY